MVEGGGFRPNPTPQVAVLGRFPPPLDGQALATRHTAEMLASCFDVERFDVDREASAVPRFRQTRRETRRYAAWRRRQPCPPVAIWTSISPTSLGHLRDLIGVIPHLGRDPIVIAVVHWGNFADLFARRWSRQTWKVTRRVVDRFVFLSDELAAACAEWIPPSDVVVIPNTIDAAVLPTDQELATRDERVRSSTGQRVIFVGGMIPDKGYLTVLEAVLAMRSAGRPIEADFVGRWQSAADRTEFEHRVSAADATAAVTHHGPVTDRSRLKELLLSADVMAFPSSYRYEAQPLVLIEAMACGLPIVASRHAGIPGLVGDSDVALLDSGSSEELVVRLSALADRDTWTAESRRLRGRYDGRFAPSLVAQQWTRLVAESVGRHRRPGSETR